MAAREIRRESNASQGQTDPGPLQVKSCSSSTISIFNVFSAGIGRTGVFIALFNIYDRAKKEGIVNVYE